MENDSAVMTDIAAELPRTAPYVFAWCPKCKKGHFTVISRLPANRPLTAAQQHELEHVTRVYLKDVASMSAAQRRELSVSGYWLEERPADAIRDPRDASQTMEWRRRNCWLVSVTPGRKRYDCEIYSEIEGGSRHH